MQATINMAQALLQQGRELWEQDRYEDAIRVLSRLLGLRVISPKVAERAQFYLGDMQLAQGHYSKARRHLAAALATGTDSGETHFLMACALDWDEDSDPRHSYRHYRRAVELDPGQPLYSSAYALMKIRRKESKYDREALRRLRDSFSAEPDDPDIVYNYVFGLMEMGRHVEAEIALRRARKRWPSHPAFEGLWHDYLVDRELLPAPRKESKTPPKLHVVSDDEPMILRFPTAARPEKTPQRLSRRARLKTALATLGDAEITELGRKLELRPTGDSRRQRDEIHRTLLDRRVLQSLIMRLSVGSRYLIQVLHNSGGNTEINRLHLRVDGRSEPRPHFGRRQAAKPLEELRGVGLAYLTHRKPDQAEPDLVMIPSDLGKLLREVMASVH